MNSPNVCAGTEGCTTSTLCADVNVPTGVRSRIRWYFWRFAPKASISECELVIMTKV
ncbi:Uncharacterised protein [Mycobacteroides abscessus subsp. abscessus]|nr:Uncharacterised protein [Mycobacteroides abscessus subsp. abscessus]